MIHQSDKRLWDFFKGSSFEGTCGAVGGHSIQSSIPCAHRIHAVPGPVGVLGTTLPARLVPLWGDTAPCAGYNHEGSAPREEPTQPCRQPSEQRKPPCCLPRLLCSAPCCQRFQKLNLSPMRCRARPCCWVALLGCTLCCSGASAQRRAQRTQISRVQVHLYRALHPNMHASQGLAHSKVCAVQRIACCEVRAAAGIARTQMHVA